MPCSPWMATGIFSQWLLRHFWRGITFAAILCDQEPTTDSSQPQTYGNMAWSFVPCFCKPVHTVSASLQTHPAPSSRPPEKGSSQPACFSGNILSKTAAVTMLSAAVLCCEASSLALKALGFCRSQKRETQLQQDLLEPSR